MAPAGDGAAAGRGAGGRPVILYDAYCGFCRWSLAGVLAWDRAGRLVPVAIESPEGERLLAGIEPEARTASWHFVTAAGELHSAGAAVPPLMRLLPGGRPVGALAARLPRATERAYRWVADRRSPLGRLVPAAAISRADRRVARRLAQTSSE